MKERAMVAIVGLAAFGAGAYACAPTMRAVWPVAYNAAASLSLPSDQAVLDADRAIMEGAWGRVRGSVALGGARPLYGGGAALGGFMVASLAVGTGLRQRGARHAVEREARKSLTRSAAKDRIDPEKKAERALVAARETERITTLRREGWFTPNAGGWYLGIEKATGKALYLPRKIQAEHPLVNGGTGSGKSARMLLPWLFGEALLPAKKRASLIVIDPKDGGELTGKSIAVMKKAGYRVWVYDPYAVGSVRFNAAAVYAEPEGVEAMVEAWVRSMGDFHSYFGPMTVALVAGTLLYLRNVEREREGGDWHGVSMADVAAWNRTHDTVETAETIVAHVAAQGEKGISDPTIAGLARQMTELIGSKQAASNVMGGVTLRLKCLNNPRVAASMAGNDIDWEEFVRVPTVLYMAIDLGTARTISPVIVTGLTATKDALSQVAARHGGVLPRPVRSITDEAVNIGKIAGLPTVVSTARSINYGLAFATQGPKDIKREYGTEGDRVMTSLLTHIVLAQSNDDDLEHYTSAQAGVTLDDLKERDYAYIRRAGLRPTYVKTRLWFTDKKLLALVKAAGSYSKADALRDQLAAQPTHDTTEKGGVKEGVRDGGTITQPGEKAPMGSVQSAEVDADVEGQERSATAPWWTGAPAGAGWAHRHTGDAPGTGWIDRSARVGARHDT